MSGNKGMLGQNLLEVLSKPENRGLLSQFHEKKFRKNEIIFYPNYIDNLIFIVKTGKVRVYLAFNEKEFTLSILEEGDAYSTHTRAYTQALEDCTLLICGTDEFEKIVIANPIFTMNTIKVLGDLLKNSITIITNLAFKETRQRLKEFLLDLIEEKGVPAENGIVLEVGQDVGQIAMIVGASRQTVSSILNEMYRTGILKRMNRKTVLVKDIEKLKQL